MDRDLGNVHDQAGETPPREPLRGVPAKAGGIPHERMRDWLLAWGTPDETPMPPEWLA